MGEIEKTVQALKAMVPKTAKMVNGRYKGGFDNWDSEEGMALKEAISALEELHQYRSIGTLDEFQESRERQTPKQPFHWTDDYKDYYFCPHCQKDYKFLDIDEGLKFKQSFCEKCGQAIDWREG